MTGRDLGPLPLALRLTSMALAAALLAPRGAVAQRPAVPVRASSASVLAAGAYELTLTPSGAQPSSATPGAVVQERVLVARTGDSVTVGEGATVLLRGSVQGRDVVLRGTQGHGALLLQLRASASGATGAFAVSGARPREVTGTATLAPAPAMVAHAQKNGSCHGLWDCIKRILGLDIDLSP